MIGITLTGADERTPISDLVTLADMGAEIGILYTVSPDGRNRYPSITWISSALGALAGKASLHICGARARQQLIGEGIEWLLNLVKRFQVNGNLTPSEVQYICEEHPQHTVITQHREENKELANLWVANHSLLVDASGGKGKSPSEWIRPVTDKSVGFAGGLGEHNLIEELTKIKDVAQGDFWIDMENSLREDDWFRSARAMRVLELFNQWTKENCK